MRDQNHDQSMASQLRHNPEYAEELLDEVLRGGDSAELAIVLRHLANAFGPRALDVDCETTDVHK